MYRISRFLFFASMGLVIACSQELDFEVKEIITSNNVRLDVPSKITTLDSGASLQSVCVIDSFLLVYTGDESSNLFDLFSLGTGRLVRSFGKLTGPEAMYNPYCHCQTVFRNNVKYLVIDDQEADQYHLVSTATMSYGQELKVETRKLMIRDLVAKEMHIPKTLFLTGQDQLVISGGYPNLLLLVRDEEIRNLVHSNSFWPFVETYPNNVRDILLTHSIVNSNKSTAFYLGFALKDEIQAYDHDLNLIERWTFGGEERKDIIFNGSLPSMENQIFHKKLVYAQGYIYTNYLANNTDEDGLLAGTIYRINPSKGDATEFIIPIRFIDFGVSNESSKIHVIVEKQLQTDILTFDI